MIIEILGAGGAVTVPRPFCFCPVCTQARTLGVPYARSGPSVFVHGLDLLIDTPEESAMQLSRAHIQQVRSVVYTHWHPDHTAGMRVFEANFERRTRPFSWENRRRSRLYLPENVAETFSMFHALEERFRYLERIGTLEVQRVLTGQPFMLDEVEVTPVPLAEKIACGYLLCWAEQGAARRVMICLDETFQWRPPPWLAPLDLLIIPAGLFITHPITGAVNFYEDDPIVQAEIHFEDTLDIVRQLRARQTVFVHLGETDRISYDDFQTLAERLNDDPALGLPPVRFAHDGLKLSVPS